MLPKIWLLVAASILGTWSATQAQGQTIAELAGEVDDLSTLASFVEDLGLASTLSSEGPFTVFAPTDDAFAQLLSSLDSRARAFLTSGADYQNGILADLIKFHVVNGALTKADIVAAVTEAGLTSIETLGPWEISPVLDDMNRVNGDANLLITDVNASNGIVHVIDSVLIPSDATFTSSVFEIAKSSGVTDRLKNLIRRADLTKVFSGKKTDTSFTVFAPTDDAIDALSPIPKFLRYNPDLLETFLGYHVVAEPLAAADLQGLDSVPTLSGEDLPVNLPGVGNGDAEVIANASDIRGYNGVVHVIDEALVPPGFPTGTMLDTLQSSNVPTLLEFAELGSTQDLDIVKLLRMPGAYTLFAPTEEAWASAGLTERQVNKLKSGSPRATRVLKRILLAHVLPVQREADGISGRITSLGGRYNSNLVSIVPDSSTQTLNGIVHMVDEVILTKSAKRCLSRL